MIDRACAAASCALRRWFGTVQEFGERVLTGPIGLADLDPVVRRVPFRHAPALQIQPPHLEGCVHGALRGGVKRQRQPEGGAHEIGPKIGRAHV